MEASELEFFRFVKVPIARMTDAGPAPSVYSDWLTNI